MPAFEETNENHVEFGLSPPSVREQKDIKELSHVVYQQWISKPEDNTWTLACPEINSDSDSTISVVSLPDSYSGESIPDLGVLAALDVVESDELTERVAKHLTEGGDDRLHLAPKTGLNKYFCPPRPVSDDVIQRSSCTCSPPSRNGFIAATNLLQRIWQGSIGLEEAYNDVRARMKRALRLQTPYEIVLHPSGSDAELLPLIIALERAKRLGCSGVVNIVVAAGEVGSGTACAAGGRHFNTFTPGGRTVNSGELLAGFPSQTDVIEIKPRAPDGSLILNYDEVVLKAVDDSCKSQSKPFFIVHAVDASKTGLRLPSQNMLVKLRKRLRDCLFIVLDACQGRSNAQELDWYLARDAAVLVTASKFFGAPGFCGAVLIPNDAAAILVNYPIDTTGVRDYITQFEVPSSLRSLRATLPRGPPNIGLLLRWTCGVTEMERFAKVGTAACDVIRRWVEEVERQVKTRSPDLELLDYTQIQSTTSRDLTRVGGCNSVVSIKIRAPCGTKFLEVEELRRLHQWLIMDVSDLLPEMATEEERKIATFKCYVGQPVLLGNFGVLRLAMGAPLASDISSDMEKLEIELQRDTLVMGKMTLLAKYCESMRPV